MRLAHDSHGRAAARIVVGVIDRTLRSHFLREPIQAIIGSRNRRGDHIARILFLHLRDPVPRIIGVVGARPVLKGRLRSSVQGIVRVGRGLTLPIEHGRKIAVVVIGVGLSSQQRISSRDRPIHIVGRVDRLLALGIGDGEQIAVRIADKDGVIQELVIARRCSVKLWMSLAVQ